MAFEPLLLFYATHNHTHNRASIKFTHTHTHSAVAFEPLLLFYASLACRENFVRRCRRAL